MWNVAPLAPACGSNIIHEYRIRVQSYLTSVRTIQETNHRETYPAPRRFPIKKGYEALDNHNLHLAFFLPVLLKIGLNELDEVLKWVNFFPTWAMGKPLPGASVGKLPAPARPCLQPGHADVPPDQTCGAQRRVSPTATGPRGEVNVGKRWKTLIRIYPRKADSCKRWEVNNNEFLSLSLSSLSHTHIYIYIHIHIINNSFYQLVLLLLLLLPLSST